MPTIEDRKFNWENEYPDRALKTWIKRVVITRVNLTWGKWVKKKKKRKLTFSRALTSTTVLVSRAMRLSLMDLATSCGVLGLKALKNENDMMIDDPFSRCWCWKWKRKCCCWYSASSPSSSFELFFSFRFQLLIMIVIYESSSPTIMNPIIAEIES